LRRRNRWQGISPRMRDRHKHDLLGGGSCRESDSCPVFGNGDSLMALTLEAEQRLQDVGLVAIFDTDKAAWLDAAKQTKAFIKANFPPGSLIRRDDVAKGLIPPLEVNEVLKEALNTNKLRGKFWIRDFADLIIDRTWDDLDA